MTDVFTEIMLDTIVIKVFRQNPVLNTTERKAAKHDIILMPGLLSPLFTKSSTVMKCVQGL